MIIGKDRTNMPVTSSKAFDDKISELENGVANAKHLYYHDFDLVINDVHYGFIAVSNKEDYFSSGSLMLDLGDCLFIRDGDGVEYFTNFYDGVLYFINNGGIYSLNLVGAVVNSDHVSDY